MKNIKTFVIDDYPITIEGIKSLFTNDKVDVIGTTNVDKAVELAQQLQPEVIILDIEFENHCGITLCQQIKKLIPQTAVLVYSANDELSYAQLALKAGAQGYISKKSMVENLITAVNQVLKGKIYLSDAVRDYMLQTWNDHPNTTKNILTKLSKRELEVFKLFGSGQTTKNIAKILSVTISTVETYRSHIKRKLELKNANELIYFATKHMTQEFNQEN